MYIKYSIHPLMKQRCGFQRAKYINQPKKTTKENKNKKSSIYSRVNYLYQKKFTQMQNKNNQNPVIVDQKYILLNLIYQGKASTIFEGIKLLLFKRSIYNKSKNVCKNVSNIQK
ncbi:unnamed protein product (macronuclear) [Paramecium tetraurelia]|uniref:Uncharacterized protein n=1 Tax=Paramecium tetraurelia TaxID=5888 RepID=A0D8V2_PARTE|nr:uncharacterized protein GSPATT00014415001 [Paramecium tetraurelia]CAK79469.1 unnamed protein product [Paramecium tetraurelia]|eukprot:XP_001446866.1 hypothetical protein (macronuclear) [Paramecium tetraurelia strain d4-2]